MVEIKIENSEMSTSRLELINKYFPVASKGAKYYRFLVCGEMSALRFGSIVEKIGLKSKCLRIKEIHD